MAGGNHRNYLDVPVIQPTGDISGGPVDTDLFRKLAEVHPDVVSIVQRALMKNSWVIQRVKMPGRIVLYGWMPPDDTGEGGDDE